MEVKKREAEERQGGGVIGGEMEGKIQREQTEGKKQRGESKDRARGERLMRRNDGKETEIKRQRRRDRVEKKHL
jgi:hypothetical protein